MCSYEVYQILLSVVENYAKNDRKFGPHCSSFDHPNVQSLDNYNFFFFATSISLVMLNVMHHYYCEAKPTTLKRPSPGDSFENHMCHTKTCGHIECISIPTSSQLT